MSNIAVRVNNLSKIYKLYDKPIDRMKEALSPIKKIYGKEHYALKNITFEIKKGETIGLIGTNGSGKSTLLKIITGVLTQSIGNLDIEGKISALLELGAGFNLEYTGIENIYLNGMMMGYTKKEIDLKIDDILNFADIGEFVYQPVKTYSSGMFVRLAFSVAINVEPDILIIDEALAVGDIKFQTKCFNKIAEYKKLNKTIILVSHDIDSIRRFCDKTIWLNSGNLITYGNTEHVSAEYLKFLFNKEKEPLILLEKKEKFDFKETNKIINFISRWGKKPDLIFGAKLNSSTNQEQVLKMSKDIILEISVSIKEELLNKKNLFLSIGIKNNKGQEVLWCTSKDGIFYKLGTGDYICIFNIKNVLNPGDYSVVVCLEYRDDESLIIQPEYIDYLEGVFFINIQSNGKKTYSMVNTEYEFNIC